MSTTPKKLIFLTSSDYGQANVVLATTYALFALEALVEIHVGSEHALEPEIKQVMKLAEETLGISTTPSKIHFHGIKGDSQFTAVSRPATGISDIWQLPVPNFANSAAFLRRFSHAVMPWEPEEVVDLYNQVVNILKEVNPDLTIVDSMHVPALTAAHNLRVKWMVLAPNTIKDFAVPYQPYGAALWKYPLIGSALPYPVPWSQMAANIGLTLILAMTMLTDTYMKTTTKLLQEQTKNDKLQIITLADLGVVYAPPPGVQIVVAFSEDLDYPISVIPPHIRPCGPVVRHAHKLTVADHELEKWLARGPTVYANLGSQFRVTAAEALEFALGLRDLLDAASSNLQILWKLKRATTGFSWDGEWGAVREAVLAEMEAGRVRIVGWVQADPCAVLQSGHIVCSVHHGGANSHHEALVAGLPQVMLPGWIDCYDYANRAELNGYGIRANKTAAPRWNRAEFGAALKEVIVGERAAMFAENAAKLAARHPAAAGRDKAAKAIMEILGSEG